VAFESIATNLLGVGIDDNGFSDVFVHDRQMGTTTRVSVESDGDEGIGASFNPSISSNGRYVAFESDVAFVPDSALWDIYVHDRQTKETTLASEDSVGVAGTDDSYAPSISGDGRYVAFESIATNLLGVGNDNNGFSDVFVHDRQMGTTTRVSVDSAGAEGILGDSSSCSISGAGRYVAFVSAATNLVAGDGNGFTDVFVHDRDVDGNGIYDEAGWISTIRVSVDSAGAEGNNNSNFPSISGDGRYVAFESDADNLLGVGNDNNGSTDVFVHDLQTGETTRVSVDLAGAEDIGNSNNPSISADGSSVTFQSDADDLVPGDTLGFPDIFVDDLQTGAGEEEGGGDRNSGSGCFIATAADRAVW
jgi:Tol biopolymer transport system component